MFMDQWVNHYGYPKKLRCDRGLHNRGIFYRELENAGVEITNAGLEALWQIGKTEREGSTGKDIARKVIHQKKVVGMEAMAQVAQEVNSTRNYMARVRGFCVESMGIRKTTTTRSRRSIRLRRLGKFWICASKS